jgi:hypothetical protein
MFLAKASKSMADVLSDERCIEGRIQACVPRLWPGQWLSRPK